MTYSLPEVYFLPFFSLFAFLHGYKMVLKQRFLVVLQNPFSLSMMTEPLTVGNTDDHSDWRLHFPAFLTTRSGHLTKLRPEGTKQNGPVAESENRPLKTAQVPFDFFPSSPFLLLPETQMFSYSALRLSPCIVEQHD